MKANLYTIAIGILFIITVHVSEAWASDASDRGVLMYKAGYLQNAEKYFEDKIAVNQKNAGAHYMLGNVFLRLKQLNNAEKEYQKAVSLNSNGWIIRYSQLALIYLTKKDPPKTVGIQSITNNCLGESSLSSSMGTSNEEQLKNSVQTISKETNSQEQTEQAECNTRVEQIYEEADRKTEQLKEELQALIAANGQPVYGCHQLYNPAPLNEALRQDYYSQIEKIDLQAKDDAGRIIASFKEKAKFREDSALSLYQSYINKHDSSISLIPMASNIYVRNYQTTDSPSGSVLPILAIPKRLSPDIADHKVSI